MFIRETASILEDLMHQLALTNARLHNPSEDHEALYRDRREIMELIARERFGQGRQLEWRPGQPSMAK